ncbi:MAG: ribonuclease HIII [Verrucomicrobia bacterium]|nr:ribonuclease HIII [Verrucomicrobiota bacterium]MDA1087369.1 ribonuclease HIII [Verrucomicrobiota bacterium]
MPPRSSFTYTLTPEQQEALLQLLNSGNFRPATVLHAIAAADGEDCRIVVYKSSKCVIQGKGAEDFVMFTLEPLVLKQAGVGYEDVLNPEQSEPHVGVDESGKGDFFGPLVVASAYVDETLISKMRDLGVKDSKNITSDKKAIDMARELRTLLGGRFAMVTIGPEAYNRLYLKMRNVNTMLAWAHARAIENILEKVPDCKKAISDQFGAKRMIEQALMKRGKAIELLQRPKAESDMAVAAASVLARAAFVQTLQQYEKTYGQRIPKGASAAVRDAAVELVKRAEPEILLRTTKCHFKTADVVLGELGLDRKVLGPQGSVTSRPAGSFRRGKKSKKPNAEPTSDR